LFSVQSDDGAIVTDLAVRIGWVNAIQIGKKMLFKPMIWNTNLFSLKSINDDLLSRYIRFFALETTAI
jgi:hypothetical protein